MQVSLQLIPEQPASELLEAIEIADELGYYACYSADEIYHKDAWLLFAAAAARTERIRLGPCVAPIFMRDPSYIAQLAATLDELSDGRAEVVMGIGNIAMLEQYGVAVAGHSPDRRGCAKRTTSSARCSTRGRSTSRATSSPTGVW